MADPEVKARIRLVQDSSALALFDAVTATVSRDDKSIVGDVYPCKEFSIVDDMLNLSDSASFTIANPDGSRSGKIKLGQRVEIDESDPEVAGGRWVRMFTGRITRVQHTSDVSGGSVILATAMDLGWHLTSCDAPPLFKTNHITLGELIRGLVHPSWGFAATTVDGPDITDNVLNRTLKQGRAGISRRFVPPKTILPFIQVEPGQKPFDILRTYLTREGLLLNVSARGGLVLFRPDYTLNTPYTGIEYHDDAAKRSRINALGRPSLTESIDGIYTEVQTWSTIVKPTVVQEAAIANNPNAAYTKTAYVPDTSPLPFYRLVINMDSEAIGDEMRKNRAVWKYQMDAFNSWQYEVELKRHSQNGAFVVSDTMMPLNDSFHKVEGTYYVQSVRRSVTLQQGERCAVTLRKPIIDPALERQLGGGAKKAAK